VGRWVAFEPPPAGVLRSSSLVPGPNDPMTRDDGRARIHKTETRVEPPGRDKN
jgi:hypothetical protein